MFVNNKSDITLILEKQKIAQAKRDCNLFILNLVILNKVIQAILSE